MYDVFSSLWSSEDRGRRRVVRKAVSLESLEDRRLLTAPVAGVDYALYGLSWADPSHITYSIAPDGVFWGAGVNDLNSVLNNKVGSGVWEKAIATALANWEAVANINIALVPDSYNDLNTLGLSQGDPRFGDIRFGGYEFPNNTTTLARTFFPPPNGSTEAGDVQVNTSLNFNAGSTYDFYSVMQHETGHALGLDHATSPVDVMYYQYQGVRTGLAAGDIAGIQAIYGARTPDSHTSQGEGLGFGSAIDATPNLNQQGQETLTNLSLATIGATEYFKVVAPSQASGTFQVIAAANDVSMLSPKVTLYDASGNVIQSQSNPTAWSNNVSVSTPTVVPGQVYYIAVTGATSDNFAVGAYNLRLSFSGIPLPTPQPPAPSPSPSPSPTPIPDPSSTPSPGSGSSSSGGATNTNPTPPISTLSPDRFEPNNTIATATPLGGISRTVVSGLNLDSATDVDVFSFRGVKGGVYQVTANGTSIVIVNANGGVLASGTNQLSVRVPNARTTLYVKISSPNQAGVGNYDLSIAQMRTAVRSHHGGRFFAQRPFTHFTRPQAPAFTTETIVARAATTSEPSFPTQSSHHGRRHGAWSPATRPEDSSPVNRAQIVTRGSL